MKYITVNLYLKNEAGEPENTYTQTIEKEVPNPEEYMLTKYNGKGSSMFGMNRVRFIDAETGENINSQKYYDVGVTGCTSMLVYRQLKSPLFKQMLKSLRNVFANPNTQIVTIVAVAVVAAVFLFVFLG